MRKALALAVVAVLFQTAAFADAGNDQVMETLRQMQRQMAQMQQTIDAQNTRIQELESHKVLEAPMANAAMQPTPPAKVSDEDFQKGIQDNLGKAVPWTKGLKFGGDFRLRAENFDYFDKNNDAGSTGTAADRARNRYRIRLRFGFEKDYGDDWKMGFRLATGTTTDQTSTNQTLGNPGYFTFKNVLIDRAYANYSPNGLKDYGPVQAVTIGAGKFDNPFLRYSTTMVWDPDVTPEGLFEKVDLGLVNTEDTKVKLYNTFGQFITNENQGVTTDAEMYGYQTALNVSTYGFGTDTPVEITGAVSYYDYPGWSQTVTNNTTGVSFLRTNTIVADNFRVIDFYPELQFAVNKLPVTLWYDFADNVGNTTSSEDVAQSGGNDIHDQDTAWGVGFKLNKAKKKGDWEAFYGYWAIGANSVVAAFNDSDFGGPGQNGYTNRKGHKFGLTYKLTDSIDVNWTGYIVRPLDPSVLVGSSSNESVFRSQADLVYKF